MIFRIHVDIDARALVEAIFEAPKCLKNSALKPQK